MSIIKEVAYLVIGGFGASERGEIRLAYALAREGGRALLFHPNDEGTSGCLEFAVVAAEGFGQQTMYRGVSDEDSESYVNLRPKGIKFYRKLIAKAGYQIPDNLVLRAAGQRIQQTQSLKAPSGPLLEIVEDEPVRKSKKKPLKKNGQKESKKGY